MKSLFNVFSRGSRNGGTGAMKVALVTNYNSCTLGIEIARRMKNIIENNPEGQTIPWNKIILIKGSRKLEGEFGESDNEDKIDEEMMAT